MAMNIKAMNIMNIKHPWVKQANQIHVNVDGRNVKPFISNDVTVADLKRTIAEQLYIPKEQQCIYAVWIKYGYRGGITKKFSPKLKDSENIKVIMDTHNTDFFEVHNKKIV
jgi:hypothetical protein